MKRQPPRVLAYYSGKVVPMDYVPDPKQRFQLACLRIHDNGFDGYVIDGERVYAVSHRAPVARSMAKLCDEETRVKVLAEVAALQV